MLRALHHVLDLAVPERLQDGGTRIIPGRGRLCNEGADKMYPEYRRRIPAPETPPLLACERFCNCDGFLSWAR